MKNGTRIPAEAFEIYCAMGVDRSYEAVATQLGASKSGIVLMAQREGWQERLAERERQARAIANTKAVETIAEMNTRHLRMLQGVQGKAISALRDLELDSAFAAVRALEMALRQERLIRIDPDGAKEAGGIMYVFETVGEDDDDAEATGGPAPEAIEVPEG